LTVSSYHAVEIPLLYAYTAVKYVATLPCEITAALGKRVIDATDEKVRKEVEG